ncbi:hypothetical protein, variant 1 [Puccinia triticina 1-1 BBBD Race 1]|uniref:PABS domain-containing protein n=2 Tax=Puccinia triticina TaxID=208348 RepID=A0A180GVW5_PUCT1|nr:uncharacterized protein PtA15_12A500 [Puccinia triticina]OAV96654.1 hypothetical protein PTTG_02957 [Puccinia triticina 1-1 BBBD Race 1]OAV96655.1 hypothetical protein, variant 1 [Puccinia triticina 1-1 BBBD Race 1]WAQ90510.1 hypothetical protein PtA15_12A500 [Puccinia triticina]
MAKRPSKKTPRQGTTSTSMALTWTGSFMSLASIIIALFGLDLARVACQSALHPLFGSIGSNHNFERSVQIIDFLLAPLANFLLPVLVPNTTTASFLAAFLVWKAPHTFGRLLSKHSGKLGVVRGPHIFQLLAYWPIRLTGMAAGHAAAINLTKQYTSQLGTQRNGVIEIICHVSLPWALHGLTGAMIPWANQALNHFPPCRIFNLAPALLLAIVVVGALLELSRPQRSITLKKVDASIILMCLFSSLLLPLPKQLCRESDERKTISTSHADYLPLARRLSATGMVLVGELTQENGSQFRFMRCDHSLLGGIWIGLARQNILKRSAATHTLTADQLEIQAIQEAESIYPTFILQSAVRLVERSDQNLTTSQGKKLKALLLGVGVGVSARVLMKDEVVVTVVEIDPMVYEYAQKYFGFPTPDGGIFLEDARVYLDRQDAGGDGDFDYIIHDVFTGGSVPSSLFTLECWRAIRAKLKVDGVLAVNFVGRPLSEAASFVLTTLFEIFPFCRAFSEDSGVPISDSDYQNMVIFCSPTSKPSFKKPMDTEGFEPSAYQSQVLNSFEKHEIDLGKLPPHQHRQENQDQGKKPSESFILTDLNMAQLDRAQVQNGLFHWEIMRKILPNELWENYY